MYTVQYTYSRLFCHTASDKLAAMPRKLALTSFAWKIVGRAPARVIHAGTKNDGNYPRGDG